MTTVEMVDLWAAGAAFLASFAVGVRARMLRPRQRAWTHAPTPVWLGLSFLALGLLMSAATIWFGAHATAREAVVYSLLAVASLVMLWNLNRHGRQVAIQRERWAAEARAAIAASGPPARYLGERRP